MAEIYLQLGSNLGDRAANLERALSLLDAAFGPADAVSEIIETEAEGFSGPAFLNCTAAFRTRKGPRRVLSVCKEIEYAMGRREIPEFAADGSRIYHNRIIDIDLLMYCPSATPEESLVLDSPELRLPHPQLQSRAFSRPLLEQVLAKLKAEKTKKRQL